jgi:hypothetical protein
VLDDEMSMGRQRKAAMREILRAQERVEGEEHIDLDGELARRMDIQVRVDWLWGNDDVFVEEHVVNGGCHGRPGRGSGSGRCMWKPRALSLKG